MLWKTHIRISKDVMTQLKIPLTDEEFSRLKEGVVAPDNWGDYPHHYGKDNEVRSFLNQARAYFLQGDKLNAYYNLGIAFHYIQDSYTTYPSYLPKHQEWEEWIENCNYVYDIHGAIQTSVKNGFMVNRCTWLAQELSRDVQGRNETLRIATMNESKKDNNTIASPKVDLNLGQMASYVVAKSILSPKKNPSVDMALIAKLNWYEGQMRMAEIKSSSEIIGLMNKRNEQARKIAPPKDIVARIRNWFTRRSINSLERQIATNKQSHFQRKHLEVVAMQYWDEVKKIAAEHSGWYEFQVPPIDTGIIINELVEVQEASRAIGLETQRLKDLLIEHNVPVYSIGGSSEIVERKGVDEFLGQTSINGFVRLPSKT